MKHKYIREWTITYEIHDGEGGLDEFMIALSSFWKVLWWFIRKSRKCCHIYIWQSGRKIDREEL